MFRQEVEEHWKRYVIMKKVNAYGLAVQPGGQIRYYYRAEARFSVSVPKRSQ